MTNQQAPEALRPIARYKIGYHTDEWGVRSSTPGGISDPSGQWVLYKDHLAALASHGQAPAQAAPAAVAGPSEAVAYLDIGAGGYLDLGTDLSNEALSRLPKGRHALVIAGTYGIDGYTPTPPAQVADSVLEDAERYRWLRQEHERVDPVCHLTWKRNLQRDSAEWVNTAVLDTAIDTARKQGGKA